jgi:hypothetical protein
MNEHIEARLKAIHATLCAIFDGGASLSNTSKGFERETFVEFFLEGVLPGIYRFGTGEITDAAGARSGQIDIVIEMPWAPSFPMRLGHGPRLYPAEAVGAALEVKSNLASQWNEVVKTADALAPLRQHLGGMAAIDGGLSVPSASDEPVPLFAMGFEGWSTDDAIKTNVRAAAVDGAFVLRHQIFASSDRLAFLRRRSMFDEALVGGNPNAGVITCARGLQLLDIDKDWEKAALTLTMEGRGVPSPLRFEEGGQVIPVHSGPWTAGEVETLVGVAGLNVSIHHGPEALLCFVAEVLGSVAKRSAMPFDPTRYV